jgi:hypothetical protein
MQPSYAKSRDSYLCKNNHLTNKQGCNLFPRQIRYNDDIDAKENHPCFNRLELQSVLKHYIMNIDVP